MTAPSGAEAPGRRAAPTEAQRSRALGWLTAEFLAERYQGQSADKIAAELGCSSQLVRDRLREFGIPLRPPGALPQGAKRPNAELLRQLYVEEDKTLAEVGALVGYSSSGVAKLLRSYGIPTRPRAGRRLSHDERLSPERLAVMYHDEALSVPEIARRAATTEDRVALRLRSYGIPLRRLRTEPLEMDLLEELYRNQGLAPADIAGRLGCSIAHVKRELHRCGIPPRQRQAPLPPGVVPITKQLLEELYVRRGLTMAEVAAEVGGHPSRVGAALRRFAIAARPSGSRRLPGLEPLTRDLLVDLYVVQRLGSVTIARRLGGHPSRILHALHRFGIPTRVEAGRGVARPPECDAADLRRWYVEERMSMEAIAQKLGVTTNQVRMDIRRNRIRRPVTGTPPTPAPPSDVLEELYVDQGLPTAEIGRRFGSAPRTVRRWLNEAAIPIAPRTTRATRRALPRELLEDLYVGEGLTSREVAEELGVSQRAVLRSLHDYGIPVRFPGPRDRGRPIELLPALYADPEVRRALRRHRIPQRPQPGRVAERFPQPFPLTPHLLSELYDGLGLCAYHIELLTGQPAEQVLDALHSIGIAVRVGALSPWRQRLRAETDEG